MAPWRLVSGEPTEPPAPVARCPRCGGHASLKYRRDSWNPFLAKKQPVQVTCEDCGLDFDPPRVEGEPRNNK